MTMNSHHFRVDDNDWLCASERAAEEGTTLSALIRQWLQDYVDAGRVDKPHKVRLTAAEHKSAEIVAQTWFSGIVDAIVAAINEER